MDLMRDMYQSGDDNMKKVIAEAFVGEMGDDEECRQRRDRECLRRIWRVECSILRDFLFVDKGCLGGKTIIRQREQ